MADSLLRPDLIPQELLVSPEQIQIIVETQFRNIAENAQKLDRTVTPGRAKDIVEVAELIEQAIRDYETRLHTTEEAKVNLVYERPEKEFDNETIAISFATRTPGSIGQGGPMESKTKNLRPILREIKDDPDNPGYKRMVLGYYYDNIVRLTCWARTNKVANTRAIWLENLMEEYTWWFNYSGVNRIFYDGWKTPVMLDINNQRYFGRPIDFYVRTEKLLNVSQKTLEEICVRLALGSLT